MQKTPRIAGDSGFLLDLLVEALLVEAVPVSPGVGAVRRPEASDAAAAAEVGRGQRHQILKPVPNLLVAAVLGDQLAQRAAQHGREVVARRRDVSLAGRLD